MSGAAPFSRVAVLGTGLIGGSFALALRRQFEGIRIAGWDKPEVLSRAVASGVIRESCADVTSAIRGADLVYIALPINVAFDLLPEIARSAEPAALVTDACSTKAAIGKAAASHFRTGARFLGGHPMTGRELAGVESAEAELFRNARYVLIANEGDPDPRVQNFAALVREIGAEPAWCDADTHDWAAGIVSHLPQLVAVALARVVLD